MLSKMRSNDPLAWDDEHQAILDAIGCKFMYYDGKSDSWASFHNFSLDYEGKIIRIKCKYSRQSIQFPYPLTLPQEFLFLWGLVASRCTSKSAKGVQTRLELQIGAEKSKLIERLTRKLGFEVKIAAFVHARHKCNAEKRPARPKRIRVIFPLIFKKLLLALGYNPQKTRLPEWLTPTQRVQWLEGYLSSQKVQTEYWLSGHIYRKEILPRVRIRFNNSALMQSAAEILQELGIESNGHHSIAKRYFLTIYDRESILRLGREFSFSLPISRAFMTLMFQMEENPHLAECLAKFDLSSFQYSLYGLILAQPNHELKYTMLEKALACSSNDIRQGLYKLQTVGLIDYYMKEGRREYFRRSNRYLDVYQKIMRKESQILEQYETLMTTNEIFFKCHECHQIFGYLEGMEDRTFRCPKCQSVDVQAIDASLDQQAKSTRDLRLLKQLSVECVI